MRKLLTGIALVFALAPILMPQPADAQQGVWGLGGIDRDHKQQGVMMHENWGWVQMGPKQRQRMQRHWIYKNKGAPETYHNARSPVRATPENVAAGARLYVEYCAACHGKDGRGRGRSPELLNYLVQTPEAGDENLLRVISEGRRRMPAFKSALQDDEIGQIIAYMRSGFP